MAKNVKTDLFAGIMNEAADETRPEESEAKKDNKEKAVQKNKKSTMKPASVSKSSKGSSEKSSDEKNETASVKEEMSIDKYIQKVEKPKSSSHTFYLTDTAFKKLDSAAKKKRISTSKLLEAMIDMTLK